MFSLLYFVRRLIHSPHWDGGNIFFYWKCVCHSQTFGRGKWFVVGLSGPHCHHHQLILPQWWRNAQPSLINYWFSSSFIIILGLINGSPSKWIIDQHTPQISPKYTEKQSRLVVGDKDTETTKRWYYRFEHYLCKAYMTPPYNILLDVGMLKFVSVYFVANAKQININSDWLVASSQPLFS